jgi:hypothetical protein
MTQGKTQMQTQEADGWRSGDRQVIGAMLKQQDQGGGRYSEGTQQKVLLSSDAVQMYNGIFVWLVHKAAVQKSMKQFKIRFRQDGHLHLGLHHFLCPPCFVYFLVFFI